MLNEKQQIAKFDCYVNEDGDIVKLHNGEIVIDRSVYIKQSYISKGTKLKIKIEVVDYE